MVPKKLVIIEKHEHPKSGPRYKCQVPDINTMPCNYLDAS